MLNPIFWIQAIGLALSQIWANKTRSFLTTLGIIVGVASVTAVIAALIGLKTKVLTEFESFGANRVFVFPSRPNNAPRNLYPWERIRLTSTDVPVARKLAARARPLVAWWKRIMSNSLLVDGPESPGVLPARCVLRR